MSLVGSVRAHASLLWLVTLGMLVFGALSLHALPSGVHPEVDFPRLVVVARVEPAVDHYGMLVRSRLQRLAAAYLGLD